MSILPAIEFPTITVGIRDPKKVKVYPLSFSDARRLKALIIAVITGINDMRADNFEPVQIATYVIALIEENILTIANMVLSEPVVEEELSLEQATELAELVFTMNEGAVKNLLGLWSRFKKTTEPKAKNQ